MKRMPKPAGVLVWTLGAMAMHAAVPFELSLLGDRPVRPAGRLTTRITGLGTVAAGAALMAWALAAHCEEAPRGWALESGLTPQYLLRRGPYRLIRNPMCAGEAAAWLGWAIFYRRPAVWAGLAIECAAFTAIVRREERHLLDRFGSQYGAYLAEVPRWVPYQRERARAARLTSRQLSAARDVVAG